MKIVTLNIYFVSQTRWRLDVVVFRAVTQMKSVGVVVVVGAGAGLVLFTCKGNKQEAAGIL